MSAALDGELDAEATRAIQQHIAVCDRCRREWVEITELDRRLRRELTLDVLEPAAGTDTVAHSILTPEKTTDGNGKAALLGLAIAVAILVAVFFARPEKHDKQMVDRNPETPAFAATLIHATGPIEVYDNDAGTWSELESAATPELEPGARLRTLSSGRCEFRTPENGTIRLDEDAELVWKQADEVLLLKGRMWCEAPSSQSLSVQLPMNTNEQVATFVCPSRSESHYAAEPQSISCTSTSGSNQAVMAQLDSLKCEVSPGETLKIAEDSDRDGQLVHRDESMVAAAKIWQLPLLASPAGDYAELSQSLTWLLAPIGYTKARHFNEHQIRELGPSGAIPLLAYVRYSSSDTSQDATRRTAMQLASEIADPKSSLILRELSEDRDEFVAELARRTLERLQNPP